VSTTDTTPAPNTAGTPGANDAPTVHTVLVVDDSAVDRHLAGAIVGQLEGWRAAFAANGREALDALAARPPDLVLTDLLMPEMDGLELVRTVRERHPLVPVILMTGFGSEDVAIQALRAGAASYVPKKSLAKDLGETLNQVLTAARTGRDQRRVLGCVRRQVAEFVLDNDVTLIPPLIGYLDEALTRMELAEPGGMVLLGVALHEALTNAILHGNLDLSSDLRETDEPTYHRLSRERRAEGPYRDRRVYVRAVLTREEATFVVRDEGNGFDPGELPDPTDPANLGRVHGRGLLLIQTFMDHVEHNERGNEITMVKRCSR
jgi:CheY-like chemotaxis protein/anti-sigma regulatory factor (Ser/Thr protein kinase)